MKCFGFLLFFMVCMSFPILPASHAERLQSIVIESISYNVELEEKESITFKLNGPRVPNVFRLNGDKPRLVMDFPEAVYTGGKNIPVNNGKLVHGIRTGVHTSPVMKTRVVIDLSSQYDVKYEQITADKETVLTIILSPIYIEKIEDKSDVAQIAVGQGIGIEKTETEKPVSPVSVENESLAEEAAASDSSGGGSQLLEISFDDSSNKGEMVIFRLNDFYPPTVSAIEEETPRVLCDFMDMQLGSGVTEVISAKGKYVERIRAARHENPDKVRVVLDLAPDRDYDLQQVFFKNDNLFFIIVNELPVEVISD